ncbi:hypothetical protein [Yinghuangia sp. YIM S09857]|uniref:hypothetical protein n=1 Tax=Yinghuangia sp. YIM S09857 TaxID=3436929 RepID=UPI003F5314D9
MSDPGIRKRNRQNKRKGYQWESEISRFMNAAGFKWKRNGQRYGGADQGDHDTGPVALATQAKDVERLSIWATAEDAAEQAGRKGVQDWVIFLKRRRFTTGEGLAVVPMWLYREMARRYYLGE